MRATAAGAPLLLASLIATGTPAWAQDDRDGYSRPSVNSTDVNNPKGSIFGIFGSDGEDGLPEGKAIDAYRHSSLDQVVLDTMHDTAFGLLRTNGHGLVADDRMVQHVQKVLARIVAASPVPGLKVEATVQASQSFRAEAYPGGLVAIPIGMLRDLESEDELAFVLAHELAHVLFRHHESDWLKNVEHKAFFAISFAESYAEKFGQLTGKTEAADKLGRAAKISKGLYEVTDHALNPAWNRKQEAQADRAGLDLLILANYKPTAALHFFKKLEKYEADRAAELEAARLQQQRLAEKQVNDAAARKNFFTAMKAALSTGVDQLTDGLKDEFGSSHYPASEREEALRSYMDEIYKNPKDPQFQKLRAVNLSPLPWADWKNEKSDNPDKQIVRSYWMVDEAFRRLDDDDFDQAAGLLDKAIYARTKRHSYHRYAYFQVRKSQQNADLAKKNLNIALATKTVSLPVFSAAIDLEIEDGNSRKAVTLLQRARQDLEDPISLWPKRIDVLTRLGRQQEIDELMLQCQKESAELAKLCRKARNAAKESKLAQK